MKRPAQRALAWLALISCPLLSVGCTDDGTTTTSVESGTLGFWFTEESASRGVTFSHTDGSSGQYFIIETLASGVGLDRGADQEEDDEDEGDVRRRARGGRKSDA